LKFKLEGKIIAGAVTPNSAAIFKIRLNKGQLKRIRRCSKGIRDEYV
jgi:hypothetical protein